MQEHGAAEGMQAEDFGGPYVVTNA